MVDREYEHQESTTAGEIDAFNDDMEEARRRTVNANARARGLIDDGEDLIDEYRGRGISSLRGVQSWVQGNRNDIDNITDLIDDIEDQIDDDGGGWTRRDFMKAGAGVGATAFAGGAVGSYLAGIWPFGGGVSDEGPVYLDRDGFQNAYEELSDAEQMSFMSDELYQDMFDGGEDDIVAGYFDFNPSEDKTDSSFKYFFVNDVDNYVNEQGEFDYSQLDSENLRMGSTSWSNTSDSVAKTFEKYGTRNKQDIPDMLEGGLE